MIGIRIKEVRNFLGYSQTDFGNRIGVTSASISKLEKGINNPSDRTVRLICQEFGISREWLETGEGDMKAHDPTASQMVMRGQNDCAKQVMAALASLDDSEWAALKRIMDKLKKAGL